MNTVNYVIVELQEAYQNEIKTASGQSVIVNSTIEDVSSIKREAKVIMAPSFTILEKGDSVIVHHNIFRVSNDIRGNKAPSNYDIGNNQYIVPLTEIFMYKRDSEWKAINPFCFVKPIDKVDNKEFNLVDSEDTHKGKLIHQGIIEYLNDDLIEMGVKKGDRVIFSKYSEYEFVIDNELYYKMVTKDVLMVI